MVMIVVATGAAATISRETRRSDPMAPTITTAELRAKLDSETPPVLVEGLPAQYYEDRHLPGAVNIPHTEVRALAPALLPDRDAEIVVYCASATCANSGIEARILGSLGYPNVLVYEAGKAEWIETGLPTET